MKAQGLRVTGIPCLFQLTVGKEIAEAKDGLLPVLKHSNALDAEDFASPITLFGEDTDWPGLLKRRQQVHNKASKADNKPAYRFAWPEDSLRNMRCFIGGKMVPIQEYEETSPNGAKVFVDGKFQEAVGSGASEAKFQPEAR